MAAGPGSVAGGALALMERAINRALRLDPDSGLRLRPLVGRRLDVCLSDPAMTVVVRFEDDGLRLEPVFDGSRDMAADATLRASAGGLLALALSRGRRSRDVSFEGDVGVIQEVRQLFAELDLDWEEQVSRLAGDHFAHQLGEAVRGGSGHVRRSAARVLANTGEYLTEERRLIPASAELDDYYAEVDRLRNDAERLEARLRRVERRRREGRS